MPINRKKMKKLKEEYGKEKGKRAYYALEQKEKTKSKRKR